MLCITKDSKKCQQKKKEEKQKHKPIQASKKEGNRNLKKLKIKTTLV